MTDEPPRPSWQAAVPPQPAQPQPAPPHQQPAPAEHQAPSAPGEAAARPSWTSVPAVGRRAEDLKLVIAVLIGLVSVTGAVLAWQSSLAGEKATDKDRQAVNESVIVAQSAADTEIIVQDARSRFADHTAAEVTAVLLEEQAERFRSSGDAAAAQAATNEAIEQRTVARRALEGGSSPVLLSGYVTPAEGGGAPTFDESAFRADLDAFTGNQNQVNPSQTVREANRLRADSQWLDGWLIALVGAVVVLTLAQVSRVKPLRLALTGIGTSVWLVSAALAFTGP